MKVKLIVPSSLRDIKLSQYQKFIKATKDSDDSEYINRQLIASLCNLTDDLVLKMSRKDYNSILESLLKILEEKPTVQTNIYHNGIKYGLIPDLQNMTVGEQADLDSIYNDYQKRDKVMAILYRPITVESRGNYLIKEYTGEEEPLDLPMDVVKGAEVFFYNILSDCMIITQSYIKDQEAAIKKLPALAKNGTGIKTFMHSLEGMFLNLKEQLNYH